MSLRKIHPDMIEESFRQDISKEIDDKIDAIPLDKTKTDIIKETSDRIEELRAQVETNKYVHPNNHPASMIVQDANNRFVTDSEKNNWNNKASASVVTTTANGLMTKEDKAKLNEIEVGATKYIHPDTHPASMIITDTRNRFVKDADIINWNRKADNILATTTSNGLMSSEDKEKLNELASRTNTTVDNILTSTSTSNALSAYQGKVLNDKIVNLETKTAKLDKIGQNNVLVSNGGTAFGVSTNASGTGSHAEGKDTTASGIYSHAEGGNTIASGTYSHAEGNGTVASGDYSHAEGRNTIASGIYSHAKGASAVAINGGSFSSGDSNIAGYGEVYDISSINYENKTIQLNTPFPTSLTIPSPSILYITGSYFINSATIYQVTYSSYEPSTGLITYTGVLNPPSSNVRHSTIFVRSDGGNSFSSANGIGTISGGYGSFSEGKSTKAIGNHSHAEGYNTTASGSSSHAEGDLATASGTGSHAEGKSTTASGTYSHAEGNGTTASGTNSHAEGRDTTASGIYSHAEGYWATASGTGSHAEGNNTTASGTYSHAEGNNTTASGNYSHSEGRYTTANTYASHVMGQYNKPLTGDSTSFSGTADAFVIGRGTASGSAYLSNAFRATFDGKVYGLSAFNSTGADYAEYFEWEDGNENEEDRVGYFVTVVKEKIRKANAKDNYILGIVSVNPSVVGDSWQDEWNEKYIRDEWGRIQYHYVDVPAQVESIPTDKVDDDGNMIFEKVEVSPARQDYVPILNPNWNSEIEYIPREKRKEWSPIGLVGKLLVRDDGTCQVNGFCKPNDEGIATASEENTGYRVMKRVSEDMVYIFIR